MKRLILLLGVVIFISFVALFFLLRKNAGIMPNPASDASISVFLNKAKDLQSKGDLKGIKGIYQQLVRDFPNSGEVMAWQKKIDDINIKLLFSNAIDSRGILYEIKPGDTLSKIAREFKTTIELIKKSNNLQSDNIIPGRKIKVWVKPFSILVYKSQNILILKSDEEIIKTYIVSTGKDNSTPVGTFKITSKLENPTWFKAGAVVPPQSPENILGTRWMGIDLPSYGIHGTTESKSLGQQVTQGCVRMSNPDVEDLYAIVPVGTEVVIVD
ncbi:MAG: L,D-transpeptidase family protein [Candidatus Omnitrophica bacterium]|nr:L,D-transpeptidase family protein [Candidatus Omnitrophota bacterium]